MRRLVLIDHGLKRPGGHNYQYAVDVLQAGEEMGYQPVLVVNRAFSSAEHVPPNWEVLRLFAFAPHRKYLLRPHGKSVHPLGIDGRRLGESTSHGAWWRAPGAALGRFRDRLRIGRYRDHRRRIDDFAGACAAMWDRLRLNPQDLVFLPSMHEFELLGFARFLKDHPSTQNVPWHLQFQFDVFQGRQPDYANQRATRERFRRQFSAALAQVSDHHVHFYADTELMADQYNRLQVARFGTLPWPINRRFAGGTQRGGRRPLRVICPGSLRREKGKHEIRPLVQTLWPDQLGSGNIQIVFQGQRRDLRRRFPRACRAGAAFLDDLQQRSDAPLQVVPHPLPTDDYVRFIRGADIAVFLYRSERYYARCSGILVEALAAGIPVIVPAGCWLSEQISEPIYDHLQQLVGGELSIDRTFAHAAWERAAEGPVPSVASKTAVRFGGAAEPAVWEIGVPGNAADVVVSFAVGSGAAAGYYARVEADQWDRRAEPVASTQASVVGQRPCSQPVSVLFHLNRRTSRLRVTLRNAYHTTTLCAVGLRATFLKAPMDRPHAPAGRVGLIAAGRQDVPGLLREMAEHYSHYRDTACEFSQTWQQRHDPKRTVAILEANREMGRATDARQPAA